MFQTEDWDEEESRPQVSALSWAVARGKTGLTTELIPQEKPVKMKKQKKEKKSLKEATGKVLKKVSKSVEVEMDRLVNSPSATVGLLSHETEEDDEVFQSKKKKQKRQNLSTKLRDSAEKVSEAGTKLGRSVSDSVLREPGHLLRLGERFASAESFLRFIGLPGKSKKSKKRKLSDEATEEKEATQESEKSEEKESEPVPPPRKKKRAGLDPVKLRSVLAAEEEKVVSSASVSTASTVHKTLADEARAKLTASRFRFLNEKLYTQESKYEIFSHLSNILTELLLFR